MINLGADRVCIDLRLPFPMRESGASAIEHNDLTGNTTTWTTDATRATILTLDGMSGDATSEVQVFDTTGSYSVLRLGEPRIAAHPQRHGRRPGRNPEQRLRPRIRLLIPEQAHLVDDLHRQQRGRPHLARAYAAGATAGAWRHLVGTYNAAIHTGRLYINGVLAATTTGAPDLPGSTPSPQVSNAISTP